MTTTTSGAGAAPVIAPHDPAFFVDPWATYQWMHEHSPVHWVDPRPEYRRPYWVVSKWADIRFVSSHPNLFCNSQGFMFEYRTMDPDLFPADDPRFGIRGILDLDPPDHLRLRRIAAKKFTPRYVASMEALVRGMVRECLDKIQAGTVGNFVEYLSEPIPLNVIAAWLGVDSSQRKTFRYWSDVLAAGTAEPNGPNPIPVLLEVFDFFDDEIADRRAHPGTDIISDLLAAELDGEKLSEGEVRNLSHLLLVAGNETTRNLMSGGAWALATHPDQRDKLAAEPSLTRNAVEEMLRWFSPVIYMARTATHDTALNRTATEDVEIRGETIRAGDFVQLLYPAANRDKDVFPDPDRFDVERQFRHGDHLGFGFGEHFCLGSHLARLETRVLFEELLGRFPKFELAGEVEFVPSTLINQIASMPVKFH